MGCLIIILIWLQDYIPAKHRAFWSRDYRCKYGFDFDRFLQKCQDIDECTEFDFCPDRLHCVNTVGSYFCGCRNGFEAFERTCRDIDECSKRRSCPEMASCENSEGSFTCFCNVGYEGEKCTDIDECYNRTSNCDVNAKCFNTEGSHDCECKAGYFGSGVKCSLGQCSNTLCPENKKCVSPTSIECECADGFFLNELDSCMDINECLIVNDCDHLM